MPADVVPMIETVREHAQRTQHLYYTWSRTDDLRFARAVLGRDPVEADRYVGVLLCDRCGRTVINGSE